MFDCGNSRMRHHREKESRRPRRFNDMDSVSECTDYRDSGRKYIQRICSKPILERLRKCEPPRHIEPIIEFDGGNSKSVYPSGPAIDLGTSGENPIMRHCNTSQNIYVSSGNPGYSNYPINCKPTSCITPIHPSPGIGICDKIVLDGGNAVID